MSPSGRPEGEYRRAQQGAVPVTAPNAGAGHLDVLDGWRGISIVLVLATHLMPIGPKVWGANEATGIAGMSLFFTLSGFLITGFLQRHRSLVDFLIRRVFRIVPLAWIYLVVALAYVGASREMYPPSFLFYANIPPFWLTSSTGHFWSLCVEMQFYGVIALIFSIGGARGLTVLLPLALMVTAWRFYTGTEVSIVTWLRLDEILAGGILSLILSGRFGQRSIAFLGVCSPYLLMVLLAAATHPVSGVLNYCRPYLAAALIGSTLVAGDTPLTRFLKLRSLRYIADVSFALYVIHPLLGLTWLGSGGTFEKYAKRPLLLMATFAFAHVSTFYYERPAIALGKRLSARLRAASLWAKP